MQPTHLVRQAAWRVTGAVCLLGALAGCRDFFYPVAPAVVPVRLALHVEPPAAALTTTPSAAAAPGLAFGGSATQAVTPNPAAAFDKADAVVLRLTAGDKVLVDERKTLTASTADRSVTLDVELPSAGPVNVAVSASLLRGTDTLFVGSTTASLTAGKPTDLTLALTGRATRLEIGGPYTARRLGSAVVLEGSLLLATGDVLSVGAEKTATLRSLDPTVVSVGSDRSVTVIANGTGRVEATLNALRDTAVITVADPCQPPFPVVTLTQAVTGSLATTDCFDEMRASWRDFHQLTTTSSLLLRATVQSTAFDPCSWLLQGIGGSARHVGGECGVSGTPLVAEYQVPASTYLLEVSSVGQKAAPTAPNTGTYGVTLSTVTEPQAGCPSGRPFTTWLLQGSSVSGRLAADDCRIAMTGVIDRYGTWLASTDTVVATVQTPSGMWTALGLDTRQTPSGGTVQWAYTGDQIAGPLLTIFNGAENGILGSYTVRFTSGLPASYDACAQPPFLLAITSAVVTRTGRLQPRIDCTTASSVRDFYQVNTPTLPIRSVMKSSVMSDLRVGALNPEGTLGWTLGTTSGTAVVDHLLPAGKPYRLVAGTRSAATAGSVGTYAFDLSTVTEPQDGCVTSYIAFADVGATATARLTAADCQDPYSTGRRYDNYYILVAPGETVTATVTGAFPTLLTHWQDTTFISSRNSTGPGQPLSITYTHPRSATSAQFQQFAIIDWEPGRYGSYTVAFTGTRLPPPALREGGALRSAGAEPAVLPAVLPSGRPRSVLPPDLRR
jgi:hypothetical protein